MIHKAKILVSDDLAAAAVEAMTAAGLEVDVKVGLPPEALGDMIHAYHGLAVRSVTKVRVDILERASNLKIVGRAGVGVDNIDVPAATARGVHVINTPQGNAVAAAELAVGYIFALARNLPQASASMKRGAWEKKKFAGVEVTGKVLGVVGFGHIGRQVAERAVGLKLRVVAYDPVLPKDTVPPPGITFVGFEELLQSADFVTLHLPILPQTRHLFGVATLAKMKRGAYLINCARGGVVDENALYEALREGHIAGAALDVFETEPCGALPLLDLDNVIASPHIGASTREAQDKVALELADVFVEFFRSGRVRNAVNKVT
jgi:D-3-phosphoglycerate dehydrogenase